jgi:hypothetical protein
MAYYDTTRAARTGTSAIGSAFAAHFWAIAALLAAGVALAGSLYLSLGMELKACALCFYQRAFAMSLVALLGLGLLAGVARGGRLVLLALPLALGGLGVAAFHVYLDATGKLECPKAILDLGTAPQQSLAAFAVVTLLLVVGLVSQPGMGRWLGLLAGLVLGGGLTVASLIANPAPPKPDKAYTTPLDTCRVPYSPP